MLFKIARKDWFITMIGIDSNSILFFNKANAPVLDKFMIALTSIGEHGMVWIVIALLLIFRKDTRKYGFSLVLSLVAVQLVGNSLLKPLVKRLRPYLAMGLATPLESPPVDFSFPSGHSSSAFAGAFLFSRAYRKLSIPIYIFGSLLAFTRIYLLLHYPSDILAGALLGTVVGYCSDMLVDSFLEYKRKKKE
ncbi:MAG: phosphatase PAP2 family protein [Eubacteriaceae bacterium]|nr:phosphatase PAP2 family protein [Eubacteriaceae bacterium]